MYKVLIVDDDENIRLFMERLLTKKFSCKVITAQNGLDGLSRINHDNPEVVFLDITMPVMDGVETLAAIRADIKTKNLPVIMLTAISDKAIIAKVMEMGIVSYLLKPLMYDVTHEKIKELFYEIRAENEEKKNRVGEKEPIVKKKMDNFLIVDTDDNFRATLRTQMETSNTILEASNGAEGLEMFIKFWPQMVCIGQNLPFMNEKLLCQKIRQLEKEHDKKTMVFAIRDKLTLEPDEVGLYDLVIPRTGGFPEM